MEKVNKKINYLPNGKVLFEGRVYQGPPGFEITFNPDKWFKFWKERINEIKKLSLDFEAISDIHSNFIHESLTYRWSKQMLQKHQEFNQLATELKNNYLTPKSLSLF